MTYLLFAVKKKDNEKEYSELKKGPVCSLFKDIFYLCLLNFEMSLYKCQL